MSWAGRSAGEETMERKKWVPVIVAFALVLSLVWALLPFRGPGSLKCGSALLGAKPSNAEAVAREAGLVQPEKDCDSKGKSRMAMSAVVAFLAVLAGSAALASRQQSKQCLTGNHDKCTQFWPALLGGFGESLSCQCECHQDAPY